MAKRLSTIAKFIFWSRWLQAPLYLGLIVLMAVYIYEFGCGLFKLVMSINQISENAIMLSALNLIDVVMIANLLIMVIVGGYETFVSRLNLQDHPDRPDWLSEVDAASMKVKVGLSLIGISSIHLLATFIDPSTQPSNVTLWQVVIHITLLLSAIGIAVTNQLIHYRSHKKSTG